MFRKERLKRKSSLEKEESDRRKQILFEREEFYQKRKGRIEGEDLPLSEWFDSKELMFMKG